MSWTFIKLVDTRFGIEYPWMLKIDSYEQLLEYEELIGGPRIVKAFSDTVNSREFQEAANIPGELKNHSCNSLTYPFILRAMNKNVGIVEAIADFADEVFTNKVKMLNNFGCIYIQSCGSYMGRSETHKIVETKELEELVYPDNKKIRYLQWPNGRHWYAKIGDTDIRVDGVMKWDSRSEAEAAVKKYLSTLDKRDYNVNRNS